MSSDLGKLYNELALRFAKKRKQRNKQPHFEISDRDEALAALKKLSEEEKSEILETMSDKIYGASQIRKRRDVFVRDTRLPPTLREQKSLHNRLCSKPESKLTKLEIELLDLVKKNLVKHGYLGPDAEPSTKTSFLSKKALTRRLNQIKQILNKTSNSPETEKSYGRAFVY